MDLLVYIRPLRKWWWLVAAATLVASISSFLATRQQPPIYQARTTLMVGRVLDATNPTGNDIFLGQQLAGTYADIAKRELIRDTTKTALGMTWLPEYNVRALPNTQLIELVVFDTNPARAQAVANELANQLVQQSPTRSQQEEQQRQDFINQELDELQARIVETRTEISDKQRELAEMFSARQISETEAQIAALQAKQTSLQATFSTLVANTQRGATNSLAIIEPAARPGQPVGPNKVATIALAGAVGFVLAASAAYLLEYMDDTVKTPDDVSQLTALPTLTGIASIAEEQGQKLITHMRPRSPISEAFRVLRTGIQFSSLDKPNRILLVTSPNPSEGKSTLAANLAVVIAQAGNNVLLIDADLRRPTQHKLFDLSDRHGLTSLLLEMSMNGRDDNLNNLLSGHLQKTPVSGLNVLSSGAIPPNPSELLGSATMRSLLNFLKTKYDFVVIDSPPILAVTDAVVLSTETDGLVLVIDADNTRRGALKQSVARLREVNANIIGVALNRLSLKSDGYRYYYYYESSHYYTEDGKSPNGKSPNGKSANGSNGTSPNGKVRKGIMGRFRKEATAEAEAEH